MSKKKKLRGAVVSALSLSMALSSMGAVSAQSVNDVKGHWAEQQIENWIANGSLKGYQDGSVKPNSAITRAEFIALVNRLFGFSDITSVDFKDLTSSNWAYNDVAIALKAGYVKGYSDNTFHPASNVSRQEAATMISQILGLDTSNTKGIKQFKDAAKIPAWSQGSIAAVIEKEIMKGYPDGTFQGQKQLTRAEAIVLIDSAMISRTVAAETVTIDQPGTYGNSQDTKIVNGDVIINVPGVTLENYEIKGNLLLASGIGSGDVTIKNVKVHGTTNVQGGGENSIHFVDSVLVNVLVNKKDGTVRLVAEGTTTAQKVVVQSSAKLEENEIKGEGFTDIQLAKELPANATVQLNGKFDDVDVFSASVTVQLQRGSIQDVNVDAAATNNTIQISSGAQVVNVVLNAISKILGASNITTVVLNSGSQNSTFDVRPSNIQGDQRGSIIVNTPSSTTTASSGGSSTGGSSSGGSGNGSSGGVINQPIPTGLSSTAVTELGSDGTITGVTTAMEYRLKGSNANWTKATGTEITGLTAGTYEVRYAAKTGYNAGAVAEVTVATYVAPNQNQVAPEGLNSTAVTELGNDGKITGVTAEMEYRLKDSTNNWVQAPGTEITGLAAGTYEVRYAAKTGYNAGAVAEVTVAAYVAPNQNQVAPEGLNSTAVTELGNDGKITGVTAEMEYRLKDSTNNWVQAPGTEITGLAAGTYEVRYAAKTGYNAGAVAEVTVATYVAPNQNQVAPEGLNSTAVTELGNDGKITGVTAEMEYRLKDSTNNWVQAPGTEITGLAAGTYEVRYAAKTGYNAGAVAEVTVAAYVAPNQNQVAPEGLNSTAVTELGNDGKITGVTAEMEYRLKDSTNNWVQAPGTEITGLAAGTYEVRYAAKTGYNAGAVAEVTVAAYVAPNQNQVAPEGLNSTAVTELGNDGKITGVTAEMEYRLKDSTNNWVQAPGTEITGLAAGTYEVRYAAKTGYNAGAVTEVTVAAYVAPNQNQVAPEGLNSTAVTELGNDGKITGVTAEMEYRLKDSTNNWVQAPGTEITGLAAGTYEVRYAAKTGYNAGAVAEVTVAAYVAPNQNQVAPEGLNSTAVTELGNDGKITGVTAEMEYRLKDSTNNWVQAPGTEITGLAAGTYEVRYAAKTGYNAGAVAEVTVAAYVAPNQNQVAPEGLNSTAVTELGNDGKITGVTAEMEYRLKDSTNNWVQAPGTEITGLAAGTYEVRYAAKTGYNAGAVTEVTVAAYVAPNQNQVAPEGLNSTAVTELGNDGKITGVTAEMEYRLKDSTNNWVQAPGTEITGLAAGTYEVRYAAKTGYNAGAVAEVTVAAYVAPNQNQVAPEGLNSTAVTELGNDGKITGVTAEMEYRLKDSTNNWVQAPGTEITGLAAGTYEVRYAAKTGYNAGAVAEVTVAAYVAPNQNQVAPEGLNSTAVTELGNDGKITGVTAEMEYRLKDSTNNWVQAPGTEITGLTAGTYEVRYAAKTGYNAGAVTEVTVAAYVAPNQNQVAPEGLNSTAVTELGNDGKITGVTAEMEYRLKDSTNNWVQAPGTEITGLAAGTYEVRYAAKTGYNAGAVAEVTVAAYVAPNQNQVAPEGLNSTAVTELGNDGKITGVTAEMEYRLKDSTNNWVQAPGTEITGLTAGTYEVRYAAKTGYNAGAVTEVTVAAYVAE